MFGNVHNEVLCCISIARGGADRRIPEVGPPPITGRIRKAPAGEHFFLAIYEIRSSYGQPPITGRIRKAARR